jgi:AraC-like DNA-binding protein
MNIFYSKKQSLNGDFVHINSVKELINTLSEKKVEKLLIQSDKTISLISFECGFETLSYFNRVFLNKKGVTPSVYRKENLI